MIQCKPYNAQFLTDATCVRNKTMLIKFNKREMKPIPKREQCVSTVFMDCCKTTEYYRIRLCDGCNTGERLYARAKGEGRV